MINAIRSSPRVECIRRVLGVWLQEWFERGMEFALACATLINARATLIQNPDGRPLAPFLSSALDALAQKPLLWAAILSLIGGLHLVIVLRSLLLGATTGRECWTSRAIGTGVQATTYIVISVAVITGPAPHQAGERYFLSAWMMFWVCVYLTSKALPRKGDSHG